MIERLCGKEEVPPQDVVVLSAHDVDGPRSHGPPGPYAFVKEPARCGTKVRFSSIRGFKGLESPVVVLCELEDLDDETRPAALRRDLTGAQPLRDRRARGTLTADGSAGTGHAARPSISASSAAASDSPPPEASASKARRRHVRASSVSPISSAARPLHAQAQARLGVSWRV